jgi:hypothetical protein
MMSMEQTYLEKMFPNGKELPDNRLIPCLLMQGGRTEVILLIKTDPVNAELLRTENDPKLLASDISVSAVEKEAGTRSDLRIALDFSYPGEAARFHGIITDPEGKKQSAVAQALLQANRIAVFVATYNFEFVSFKAFSWNPASQPELQSVLEEAAGTGEGELH